MPEEVRTYVKNNVLGSLGSEGYRPSAAAQCVQVQAFVSKLPLCDAFELQSLMSAFLLPVHCRHGVADGNLAKSYPGSR